MKQGFQSKRFDVIRHVGEGGMGTVYEVRDNEKNERAALKVLRSANAQALMRFKREFRSLQDLHHPNLVTLGELISEGDAWFFTMELVPGEDFVAYCTAPPNDATDETLPAIDRKALRTAFPFDERRTRASLVQLTEGLIALHDARKVHRDIKPSNVLVTGEGRVVVLDFGLVADLMGDFGTGATELDVVGTPAYMAPEQAASKTVGPAADWYSVGVLLYEVLTGSLPFSGAPLEVLLRKQKDEPPRPITIAPDIPPDLDALCTKLLRFDPAIRATGQDVLRALNAVPTRDRRSHVSIGSMTQGASLIGRDEELDTLRRAYDDSRAGKCVSVVVRGESGIGKSVLVRHFTDANAATEREMVVLAGRCFEREAVPYKAFDGVVDALSRFLARLAPAELSLVLPSRPAAVLHAFPVLRRVEAIGQPSRSQPQPKLDPHELRSRAFAALRELLTRLADRRPLVIVVDDLQWADADSLALLGELLRPPDPPSFLFLTTVRDQTGEGTGVTRIFADVTNLPGDVRTIELGRLSPEHARELAQRLVETTAPGMPVSIDAVAEESDGHPLFIDEIVRYLFHVGAPDGVLRLDDALWSRIATLDEGPRQLVELVAVSGAPVPQEIVAKALGVAGSDFARLTSFLRVAHLIRTTGARGADVIEPYHGRIRSAVISKLTAETRRQCHWKLAVALETSGSRDAEALAIHWFGAGDADNASKYMLAAADQASDALAFDRAAQLYEQAIALRNKGSRRIHRDEERKLETRLGDALSKAGRGAPAARAFRAAARGATAAEALDLERRAGEQLLRSGHFDEGLQAIKGVLVTVGVPYPESSLWVMVAFVFWQLVLRIRGLRFKESDTSQVPAHELTRLDIVWSIAFSLALVDVLRARVFQTRNLLRALAIGEPQRLARALALEVTASAQRGSRARKRTEALAIAAKELADRVGTPYALAWAMGTRGIAHYLNGEFTETLSTCGEAEFTFRNDCSGTQREMTSMQIFMLSSLALLGRLRELGERKQAWLREATERGDRYAEVNMCIGFANGTWLVQGDPAAARREVGNAMKQWSKQGFHLEHFYELLAYVNANLYTGEATSALRRIEDTWRAVRGSLLSLVQSVRVHMALLRARSAIAVAAENADKRRALLTLAERDLARVSREKLKWSRAPVQLLRASVANVHGDRVRVVADLRGALDASVETGSVLCAAIARRSLAARLGGDEGKAFASEARDWFTTEGVADADRLSATIAPSLTRST